MCEVVQELEILLFRRKGMLETVICGGNEIIKKNIPFGSPDISDLEINEVVEVLKSGWITTGSRTKELERRLAKFCNTSKVVCLKN